VGRLAGMRTEGGNPSQKARELAGNKEGKFPIFDQKSATSAIKLRGYSDNPDSVLNRATTWGRENDNQTVLNAVERARQS